MSRIAPFTAAACVLLAACGQQPDETDAVFRPASSQPASSQPPSGPIPTEPGGPDMRAPPPQASDDWRDYALPADVDRMRRLDEAWETGLRRAREEGGQGELAALGPLADPGVVLARPHPAPGQYRCRTVKLGGALGLVAYGWFRCEVELTPGGDLIVRKLTGSQRQVGNLYPDGPRRLVYLGGMAWGNEAEASAYGQAAERDQVGVWERIGDQRYRLALPWPRVESDLDLLEVAR